MVTEPPKVGEIYMWAPPGKMPKKGKVIAVSATKVILDWGAAATQVFLLPLDEFFFKVEEAEND